MSRFSGYLEEKILSWIKGVSFGAAPVVLFLSVHTSDPGNNLSDADVTNDMLGGRVEILPSVWGLVEGLNDNRIKRNVFDINATGTALTNQVISWAGIWDEIGNPLFSVPYSAPISYLIGDSFSIPVGLLLIGSGLASSDYLGAAIVNWVTSSSPSPLVLPDLYVGLYSSLSSDNTGIEVTTAIRPAGRVAISASDWSAITAVGVDRRISNAVIIDFGISAAGATVGLIGLSDAATGGNLIVFSPVSQSQTYLVASRVNITIGQLGIRAR